MTANLLAARLRIAAGFAALASVGALVAEFGFRLGTAGGAAAIGIEALNALLYVAAAASRVAGAENRRELLRATWLELSLAAGMAVALPAALAWSASLAIFRLCLLARIALSTARLQDRVAARASRPALLAVAGFVILIGGGAVLLLLPLSRAEHARPLSGSDAIFTSTSAACVTGLSVRDTGGDFSFRGQAVLLVLIQLGGLGPVTLAVFLASIQQRSLRVRQMTLLRELLSTELLGDLRTFFAGTLVVTLLFELVGAALLYPASPQGPMFDRAWWALFHSVSAFCNAGFAFPQDSFAAWGASPRFLLTITALVVAGGLGFPALLEFARRVRAPRLPEASPLRLSLNSRLVLATTVLLLFPGALLYWLSERHGSLAALPSHAQIAHALFASAMPRTAGFSVVDPATLAPDSQLLLLALMAIGAAPASTGGGLKVTTVAILALTAASSLRNRDSVEAFRRTLPRSALHAAVAIFCLYSIAVAVVTAALLVAVPGQGFLNVLFEAVSALSTVGLSAGVTAHAGTVARLILCAAMLAGRVGPLALFWAVIARPPALRYQYPEESVVVG